MKLLFILLLSVTASFAANVDTTKSAKDIDAIMARHWKSAGVQPNALASDEVFVRRIYLDLAGRIPTGAEAKAFLETNDSSKRQKLIADLLSRDSYVSNFFNLWADILRYKSTFVNRANVVEAAYELWVKDSLRTNKPYDQFARELLSAKGLAWENGAVGYYNRDPEMPLDNMALTSRVFLGTRIECAQCHDHPFDKWKQTEFYQLAAFTYGNKSVQEALNGVRDAFRRREQVILDDFKREKSQSTDTGKAAEKRRDERFAAMEFRTVLGIIRKGIGQLFSPVGLNRDLNAKLKLPKDFHEPDGKPGDVMSPAPLFGAKLELAPGTDPAEAFAKWVTSPENPRFTRVIVNRLWKRMFGAPITEFFDDIKDASAPGIPELESYLERLMVSLGYDMKAFLAVLANTRAYQASVMPDELEPGRPCHFTGPVLRRMTAEQVWDSLVALSNHDPDARDVARETRLKRRIAVSQMAYDAYVAYDGEKLVDLGYAGLEREKELLKRETVAREAAIAAKRSGDKEKEKQLAHQQGDLARERGQAYVKDFLRPLMVNLAKKRNGSEASIVEDETYKMNTNPAVLTTETWKKTYLPGYGPVPKTKAQIAAEAEAARQAAAALAEKLGLPAGERDAFVKYADKTRAEWIRASELESPAPRGHFLRTMGQSDRDFVENSNPNASIPQALALMNSDLISDAGLLSRYSPLMRFVANSKDPVEAVTMALLSRKPTAAERTIIAQQEPVDLIYALLNTKQFLFIQ